MCLAGSAAERGVRVSPTCCCGCWLGLLGAPLCRAAAANGRTKAERDAQIRLLRLTPAGGNELRGTGGGETHTGAPCRARRGRAAIPAASSLAMGVPPGLEQASLSPSMVADQQK